VASEVSAVREIAMLPTPSYRADIDGLRAIAVLLVVIYHYGLDQVPGGFIGVDVFFVISGYLITSVVAREIAEGRFSIAAFYSRRIRRILPALTAVIVASLVVGYFVLMPGDYRSLGWQAGTAVLGISNLYFLWNTGYFDQAADLLPLLHTWSLGVEEQFYLVWPIILVAITRLSRNAFLPVILILVAIIASSFAVACFHVSEDPQAAFYLPYTRAWELALGALLVFAPRLPAKWAQVAAPLGLMLVAGSAIVLTSSDPFPGMNALAPCLGAALVIWPSERASITARLLSFEPLRQIGLASYSLYLWHWPILVFYRHYNLGEMPSAPEAALLLVASVGLAFLSLRLIEAPFRRMHLPNLRTLVVGISGTFVMAVSGFALAAAEGVPMRLSSAFRAMESREVMWTWDCPHPTSLGELGKVCVFGEDWETSTDRVFLWGDSHAIHFVPLLNTVLNPGQSAVLFHACPASMGGTYHRNRRDLPDYRAKCIETRETALRFLENTPHIKTVVLASLWQAGYLSKDGEEQPNNDPATTFYYALSETLEVIRASDRKTVLVANFASFPFDPMGCVFAQSTLLRTPCPPDALVLPSSGYEERNADLNSVFSALAWERVDVEAVFPGSSMCASGICQTEINGEFLFQDHSHIRRNLSTETLEEIADTIGLTDAID
jgi:peptidoglycan/LPS O-acetylase OafA/YrhL